MKIISILLEFCFPTLRNGLAYIISVYTPFFLEHSFHMQKVINLLFHHYFR